jgi:hypothetical protein
MQANSLEDDVKSLPPAPTLYDELFFQMRLRNWPPELRNWLIADERYHRSLESSKVPRTEDIHPSEPGEARSQKPPSIASQPLDE